ncbi:hypothetical protein [Vibrio cyclitrophicus]|uniref:hypothetical protein n=1 Tax=Vibrio cyclitrophicus TaxID=47951 RepID=UPI0003797F43|nr:hypothetical protein [Vibrio cyclitrophicus]
MIIDDIESYYLFLKLFFYIVIFAVVSVVVIIKSSYFKNKYAIFVFMFSIMLAFSFFYYQYEIDLKIGSYISTFVSGDDSEYDLEMNGNIYNDKRILHYMSKIDTRLSNQTFSSRLNKRVVTIKRNNMTNLKFEISNFNGNDNLLWVYHVVPGTNYKYIGVIGNYDFD